MIQFAKREEEEEEEEEEDHHHHLFVKSSSSLSGETSSTPQSSSLSQSSTRRKMNKKKKQRPTALDVSEQKLGTLLSTFTTAGQRRRTASTHGRIDASGNEIGIGESVQISSVGSLREKLQSCTSVETNW